MKNEKADVILLFLVLFAAISLFSSAAAMAEFVVPPLTGRVVDAGYNFTPEERERIEKAILQLESATGGQMVVVTLTSLSGLSIEEVGIKLGDAWKIGNKGKDDGAILIIVVSERKMRLEVGLGWEGPINDARAGDVIRGLVPFFRVNKYADGAVWAVESVQQYVTGKEVERTVSVPANSRKNQSNSDSEYLIPGIICSLPLIAMFFWCLWAMLLFILYLIWEIFSFIMILFGITVPEFPDVSTLLWFGLDKPSSSGSGGSSSSSSSSSRYSDSDSWSSYSSDSSSSSSSSDYSGGGGGFGGGGASGSW